MKAPSFDYAKPHTPAEVCALLRRHGDDARILAGGQTLLATLNMRLSEPSILIDITGLDSLKGIEQVGERIRIGALARHCEIERSALVARHLPLLSKAAPHVAHAAIRNRGTLGGSLAFADPAAEWPACALALDAEMVLTDGARERRVGAGEFFVDLYETALRPDELLVACEFPLAAPRPGASFIEFSRRHGDYAIAGVAASGHCESGTLSDLRIVFFGVGNTPVRARMAESVLSGHAPDAARLRLAREALAGDLDPQGDLYTSAEAKRHLAGVLFARAVNELAGQQ